MLTMTNFILLDKQQKGSFYINGYSAELVYNLRKDSKKNYCFEMNAPGRRSYQVCQHTHLYTILVVKGHVCIIKIRTVNTH